MKRATTPSLYTLNSGGGAMQEISRLRTLGMTQHEHESRAHQTSHQQMEAEHASHSQTPNGGEANAGASIGDEVLNILADVEQKFTRLRDVQKKHEQELTTLEQRRAMLDETERELDEELNKLVEQRNTLEQAQKDIAQQSESLEKQRAEIEEQFRAVESQQKELSQFQEQIEAEQTSLRQQSTEIEKLRSDLSQEQRKWNEHRQQSESSMREQLQAMEQRRDELTQLDNNTRAGSQKLQQQREELHKAQQQFEQHRELWNQQAAQREQELQSKAEELERQAQQIREQQQILESEQEALQSLEQQLQERESALAERAAAIEAQQKQNEQIASESKQREQEANQKLESARQKLSEAQQQSQQLRDALEQAQAQAEQYQSELASSQTALEQTEADRDEAQKQVSHLIQDVERLAAEVEEQRAAVTESDRRLQMAGEKLKHFAEILNEQAPQLEQGAAAMAMVDDQHRQIEQLTKQLSEAKRAGNPDELHRKEQRIQELTEALRQARGQIGGDKEIADLQIELAELSRQNDTLRSDLESAKSAADLAKQQLQQKLDAKQGDEARAQERQLAIDALSAEHEVELQKLQREHDEAIKKAKHSRDEQVRSLQEKVSQLQESLIDTKQRAAAAKGGADVKAFQKRIDELEQQLAQAQSSGVRAEQTNQELRAKAKKLSAAAHHLERRRKRLERTKQLLEQRIQRETAGGQRAAQQQHDHAKQADRDDIARQLRAIETQRKELSEVRQFLSHSERELMRRWARPRAVASAGWLVFLVLISGAASYFASNIAFPAPVTASVTFAPQPENPAQFTPDDALAWQQWHAEYILSPEFQSSLAKRCADRRLEPYGSESQLAARLSKDLDIDLSEPKRLTVTLKGESRSETQHLLDIFAGTLAIESAKLMDRHADDAKAVPIDERREDGRIMYASLSPSPPIQSRLQYIAPIFGGIMLFLFAVMGFIYARLVRSKRVFEAEQELFATEQVQGEFTAVR